MVLLYLGTDVLSRGLPVERVARCAIWPSAPAVMDLPHPALLLPVRLQVALHLGLPVAAMLIAAATAVPSLEGGGHVMHRVSVRDATAEKLY